MIVTLSKKNLEYVKQILSDVDGVSYDPIYRTMAERIDSTTKKSGKNVEFNLEEFELYSVLEAFNYYSEMAEEKADADEMKKLESVTKEINEQTGLSL